MRTVEEMMLVGWLRCWEVMKGEDAGEKWQGMREEEREVAGRILFFCWCSDHGWRPGLAETTGSGGVRD